MVSANPTGPDHGRLGAQRRLRRLGRAAARVRRPRRSSASTTSTTPARRSSASGPPSRRAARARSRRRTATRATYVDELARPEGDPVPRDARADRGHARALPHPLRQLGAAERAGGAARRGACRGCRHYEEDGAVWRAHRASYGDEKDRVLVRSAERGGLTYLRGRRRRLPARQARARLRPARLRPRRRPPRRTRLVRGRRADARLRPGAGSRCCSTSSST